MDLLLLGKTPIDPDHPTSSDSRYEPDFEQLQGEIDKLSSPSAATTIDWKRVGDLSSEILTKKIKEPSGSRLSGGEPYLYPSNGGICHRPESISGS